MTREERLVQILDLLAEAGSVTVDELVERVGISSATARRDLDALAERRLLARTHGGARALAVSYDLPVRYAREDHAPQKNAIATAAQQFVAPGSRVGLSGGTTCTAIAAEFGVRPDLEGDEGLTVVTNAINIAAQLVLRPHVRVVMTGGVVHARSYELVGPYSDLMLERITLDVSFIGVNGLDPVVGPTVTDESEARVNAMVAERATQAWIVADSAKLGIRAFATVGSPGLFHGIITDAGIDTATRRAFEERGFEVVVA